MMRFLALALLGVVSRVHAFEAPSAEEVRSMLQREEGEWDAAITFYEDDVPSGTAVGTQRNRIVTNSNWAVTEIRVEATETLPAYEGHGVWGYDPVARTWVNTWVDSNDRSVRTDYGYWDSASSTLVWSSKQPDGEGHFIDYRFTEAFDGDRRTFTAYQLGIVVPNPHKLVEIVFKRRPAKAQNEQ